MDWKTIYLTSNGRMGQRDFWIAWAILFVAALVASMVPVIGHLITLVLIYPFVCIAAKRLHDFGRSGWLAAVPYVVAFAAAVVGGVMGGMAMMLGALGGRGAAGAAAVGGFGLMVLLMSLAALAGLAFLLWVGLTRGDPQPNAYGPPPEPLFGGAPTTPTAV